MASNRIDLDQIETTELLRRGIGAARAGDADIARRYLEELVERNPADADGWLWLASVDPEPQAKRAHFQKVLELRPGDVEAQAGLEGLADKYGRGILTEDPSDGPHPRPCTWHADRETLLRCARCDRPMCTACARQHPVGLRCKECAQELRSPLYKVTPAQWLRGVAAGTFVSFAAALVVGYASRFGWLVLLLAWVAGFVIGDAVSWGAGRKRGRQLQAAAVVATALGVGLAGPLGLGTLAGQLSVPLGNGGLMLLLILGSASAVQRLR